MSTFYVKVRDKRTKKEAVLTVSGQADADAAKAHVENMPGSQGGGHPGFEVLAVSEDGKFPAEAPADAAPLAEQKA